MEERSDTRPRGGALRRFAALGTLAAIAVLVAALILGSGDGHRYRLLFQSAGQLVEGSEVMIGGHPVGSVEEIGLADDGTAEVEVSLDRELHQGTTAVIRTHGLVAVANRYVSMHPGPDSEPPLDEGTTLGLDATTTIVDVDQVFDAFDGEAREGLRDFIQGQAGIYAGKGKEANATYRYLEPALYQTNQVLDEVNADRRLFREFITSGARVFTALSDREVDLAESLSNADAAFDAIASENRALSRSLQLLPPAFRQSNTTFANLRVALDDLDSLVETATPATRDLAPFLRDLDPVLSDLVPLVRDLRQTVKRKGRANDLGSLTRTLPRVDSVAGRGFRSTRRAIEDFQPTLDFARPYAPELVGALAKLGQVMTNYDASGHYARVQPAGVNLFGIDPGSGQLTPLPPSEQYAPFGSPSVPRPCPGGATQPAPDESNPFVAPRWPESGLDSSECDPADVPPGP